MVPQVDLSAFVWLHVQRSERSKAERSDGAPERERFGRSAAERYFADAPLFNIPS